MALKVSCAIVNFLSGWYFLVLILDQSLYIIIVFTFTANPSFFVEQSGVLGKISKAVKFPEHLNLSQYMCRTDDSSPVYSLYAVVVHRNIRNATVSGHYVCYVKDSQGKWHEMDDNKVNNAF